MRTLCRLRAKVAECDRCCPEFVHMWSELGRCRLLHAPFQPQSTRIRPKVGPFDRIWPEIGRTHSNGTQTKQRNVASNRSNSAERVLAGISPAPPIHAKPANGADFSRRANRAGVPQRRVADHLGATHVVDASRRLNTAGPARKTKNREMWPRCGRGVAGSTRRFKVAGVALGRSQCRQQCRCHTLGVPIPTLRGFKRGKFRKTARRWTRGASIVAKRSLIARIWTNRHGARRRRSPWPLRRKFQ